MDKTHPTPYVDVNEILGLLLSNVHEILGDQFVGMYLFGSLANGGFDRYSDIDVLIVTEIAISDDLFRTLQSIHKKIASVENWYSDQLEVSYIPKQALRRYDPHDNQHPHLDRGGGETLHIRQHDTDWIVQRYLLRERGITLVGPQPKSLIDPVSTVDLRKAMQPILFEWYAHFLDKPEPFGSRGYQSYIVLSLCRILYTMHEGDVVSKATAADWAQKVLNERWAPLIERAWNGRQNSYLEPAAEDIKETLEFIRFVMREFPRLADAAKDFDDVQSSS